jgi:AraC-like DNA-binding protein
MSESPNDFTEQPPNDDPSRLLREGLRFMQISGAIFLRAHFGAPWRYASPAEKELTAMLRPGGRRVILFHIFTEGSCRILLRGKEETVEAGDIAIFPSGDPHHVGDPADAHVVPIGELLPPRPWKTLPVVRHGGGGRKTSMVCGYLYCDDLPFNPVLGSLPPFLKVRPSGGPLAKWVDASVQYALASAERALDDDLLLQRLPELLFVECLCEHLRREPVGQSGWLAALADPVLARALGCLHAEPAHPWTLETLAKQAATSRSVLDERFRALLGKAPMGYLTSWRLQLAARQLRTTRAGLAEIAQATGYGSEASLSRAFKREVGLSPSQWRASSR